VRAALAQAPVQLSIFKMMANAETCFIALTRLGGTILARQKLGAKLGESRHPDVGEDRRR
jgi:hypothetical protein